MISTIISIAQLQKQYPMDQWNRQVYRIGFPTVINPFITINLLSLQAEKNGIVRQWHYIGMNIFFNVNKK